MVYRDDDQLPAEARDEIVRLLRNGDKIQAIKVHRKYVPGTLKESKTAVEAMAAGLGIPVKSGCLSVMAMAVVLPLSLILIALS